MTERRVPAKTESVSVSVDKITGESLRLQLFFMAPKKQKIAPRKPRLDAQRNRELILEVAKEAFTHAGVSASLDDIAKEAGVGAGTLYRHFPTRDALIEAVYRTEVEKLAAAERKFSDAMPPVEALRAWMLLFVDYIATKQIIAPALNSLVGGPTKLYEGSRSQNPGSHQFAGRARHQEPRYPERSGALRSPAGADRRLPRGVWSRLAAKPPGDLWTSSLPVRGQLNRHERAIRHCIRSNSISIRAISYQLNPRGGPWARSFFFCIFLASFTAFLSVLCGLRALEAFNRKKTLRKTAKNAKRRSPRRGYVPRRPTLLFISGLVKVLNMDLFDNPRKAYS